MTTCVLLPKPRSIRLRRQRGSTLQTPIGCGRQQRGPPVDRLSATAHRLRLRLRRPDWIMIDRLRRPDWIMIDVEVELLSVVWLMLYRWRSFYETFLLLKGRGGFFFRFESEPLYLGFPASRVISGLIYTIFSIHFVPSPQITDCAG